MKTGANDDFRKGYRFQERGQWRKAMERYLRVSETSAEYVLAVSGAAYCRACDGDFKEAVRLCRQLTANTSPEELQARLWLQYDDENPYLIGAYAAVQLGDREAAEKFLELFARHPGEIVQRAMLAGPSSFWDVVRAAYAIRNCVAHEGYFSPDQVDVAVPDQVLASDLIKNTLVDPRRWIRNQAHLAVRRELNKE